MELLKEPLVLVTVLIALQDLSVEKELMISLNILDQQDIIAQLLLPCQHNDQQELTIQELVESALLLVRLVQQDITVK